MTEIVDDVMEGLDFEYVHEKMVALEWQWYDGKGSKGVPTLSQLKATALRLCTSAEESCGKDLKETMHATGGFIALCSYRKKKKCLQLIFAIDHYVVWSE